MHDSCFLTGLSNTVSLQFLLNRSLALFLAENEAWAVVMSFLRRELH